ncbi:MAG TPA: sulfotransferase domain-containing protein [Candidatus Binataceae bacterium]|nr:sulfotransferase domain-containing protein [Candidatus Binataceae bacterium]
MTAARIARLPDFIAVGPGRTATTWLYEKLKGHVDLPAGIKETDFFTTNYAKGIDWYARHFRYASGAVPIGEVNPYFGFREAAERIQRHIPGCKIICTFRNPVERIYSSYKLWRHYTQTSLPMDEFLVKVPQVIEVTRYARHLPDWQSRFGAERVLVLLNDDLRADPQGFLDQVCDFLEIARYPVVSAGPEMINSINDLPRYPRVARRARHLMDWLEERQAYGLINHLDGAGVWRWCFGGGAKFGPIDPKIEAQLHRILDPEIDALARMLGRNLAAWKIPSAARSDSSQ